MKKSLKIQQIFFPKGGTKWMIRVKEVIPYVVESVLTIILWEAGKLLFG